MAVVTDQDHKIVTLPPFQWTICID